MDNKKILPPLLNKRRKSKHRYTSDEIRAIVAWILDSSPYYREGSATPIIQLSNDFDLHIKNVKMQSECGGELLIDGTDTSIEEKYDYSKIVKVNSEYSNYERRVVIANELCHYLFFYRNKRGQSLYSHTYYPYSIKYSNSYQGQVKNRFVMEILLPGVPFVKFYERARELDTNPIFLSLYLSRRFEVPTALIDKRILDMKSSKS